MSTNIALSKVLPRRYPRSRNGCLTCRRRKVRCNEQRPLCSHCERLNLQCTWKSSDSSRQGTTAQPHTSQQDQWQPYQSPESNLDFNNILWQGTLDFNAASVDWSALDEPHSSPGQAQIEDGTSQNQFASCPTGSTSAPSPTQAREIFQLSPGMWSSGTALVDVERNDLVEHFLSSVVPPILASQEVGPKWTSAKLLLFSLAATSDMVQDAMAAFSALQRSVDLAGSTSIFQKYYQRSKDQLFRQVGSQSAEAADTAQRLSSSLVVIFFLSYSALLSDLVNDAHVVLHHGAELVRNTSSDQLTSSVRRLISWVRVVDSRATSTGGSGVFLSETDRQSTSPQATVESRLSLDATPSSNESVEEILFDMLYIPGLVFYQKVQSIMARVSTIDKWHRPRGTVKDETEVMAVAAIISGDLLALEEQRPPIMDAAVAGNLTEKHLMKGLSTAIVRSYRMYWANYHAGHIHLHRVAHTHLQATDEVHRARNTIKHIARLLGAAQESLPANFIWPLLMASCEEEDVNERAWMVAAIRGMQSNATNARPIADVIEEVHRRQDATQRRADVRQTSIDLFNKSFAVF